MEIVENKLSSLSVKTEIKLRDRCQLILTKVFRNLCIDVYKHTSRLTLIQTKDIAKTPPPLQKLQKHMFGELQTHASDTCFKYMLQ